MRKAPVPVPGAGNAASSRNHELEVVGVAAFGTRAAESQGQIEGCGTGGSWRTVKVRVR